MGNAFELDCRALGVPAPNITWWKDGAALEGDSTSFREWGKVQMGLDGNGVGPDAAGKYTCIAENQFGKLQVLQCAFKSFSLRFRFFVLIPYVGTVFHTFTVSVTERVANWPRGQEMIAAQEIKTIQVPSGTRGFELRCDAFDRNPRFQGLVSLWVDWIFTRKDAHVRSGKYDS